MKGRVNWNGRQIYTAIDWIKFVDKPAKEGYCIEAFASADAIIDSQLQGILRQIYGSFESQSLIGQLDSVREETKFFGSGILKILESVGVIDKNKLGNKIRDFKGKRNKVSHTIYGEYSLISPLPFKTQEEFDSAIEKEVKKYISKAFDIFTELLEIREKLCNKFEKMSSNDKTNWLIQEKKDI